MFYMVQRFLIQRTVTLYKYIYLRTLYFKHYAERTSSFYSTMQYLSILTLCALCMLVVSSRSSNATRSFDEEYFVSSFPAVFVYVFQNDKGTCIILTKNTCISHEMQHWKLNLMLYTTFFTDSRLWNSVQWIGMYIPWLRVEWFWHMWWTND